MKKIILILVMAVTAFAQMNYTPKNDYSFTESQCWEQFGDIICDGGEMNTESVYDRVIADTVPVTDCISYDSLKNWEKRIEKNDSIKYYVSSTPRKSHLRDKELILDWSCTDPFILNSRRLSNRWEDLNHNDVYVRILKVTLKGYNCPENPTKIFYSNTWLAELVLNECVENPEDYEVHDLDYEEWRRKNGVEYPGTIIRKK